MNISELGFQNPKNGIRTLSQEEIEKRQKEQAVERRNAGMRRADSGDFFLEYFNYRDKKVSQSPIKMAQVMSKTKADNLSKSISDGDEKPGKEIVSAVAEELGVSPEQLTITVEKAGNESAESSDALKQIANMISQKNTIDKYKNKMLSEIDLEDMDSVQPNWAKDLQEQANKLEEAADAVQHGSIVTGSIPSVESMKQQANIFREVANLCQHTLTEKAKQAETI